MAIAPDDFSGLTPAPGPASAPAAGAASAPDGGGPGSPVAGGPVSAPGAAGAVSTAPDSDFSGLKEAQSPNDFSGLQQPSAYDRIKALEPIIKNPQIPEPQRLLAEDQYKKAIAEDALHGGNVTGLGEELRHSSWSQIGHGLWDTIKGSAATASSLGNALSNPLSTAMGYLGHEIAQGDGTVAGAVQGAVGAVAKPLLGTVAGALVGAAGDTGKLLLNIGSQMAEHEMARTAGESMFDPARRQDAADTLAQMVLNRVKANSTYDQTMDQLGQDTGAPNVFGTARTIGALATFPEVPGSEMLPQTLSKTGDVIEKGLNWSTGVGMQAAPMAAPVVAAGMHAASTGNLGPLAKVVAGEAIGKMAPAGVRDAVTGLAETVKNTVGTNVPVLGNLFNAVNAGRQAIKTYLFDAADTAGRLYRTTPMGVSAIDHILTEAPSLIGKANDDLAIAKLTLEQAKIERKAAEEAVLAGGGTTLDAQRAEQAAQDAYNQANMKADMLKQGQKTAQWLKDKGLDGQITRAVADGMASAIHGGILGGAIGAAEASPGDPDIIPKSVGSGIFYGTALSLLGSASAAAQNAAARRIPPMLDGTPSHGPRELPPGGDDNGPGGGGGGNAPAQPPIVNQRLMLPEAKAEGTPLRERAETAINNNPDAVPPPDAPPKFKPGQKVASRPSHQLADGNTAFGSAVGDNAVVIGPHGTDGDGMPRWMVESDHPTQTNADGSPVRVRTSVRQNALFDYTPLRERESAGTPPVQPPMVDKIDGKPVEVHTLGEALQDHTDATVDAMATDNNEKAEAAAKAGQPGPQMVPRPVLGAPGSVPAGYAHKGPSVGLGTLKWAPPVAGKGVQMNPVPTAAQAQRVVALHQEPIFGSSNIRSYGYDPSSQILSVRFHNPQKGSDHYLYGPVPAEAHAAWVADNDSKGEHHYWKIRSEYPYVRVTQDLFNDGGITGRQKGFEAKASGEALKAAVGGKIPKGPVTPNQETALTANKQKFDQQRREAAVIADPKARSEALKKIGAEQAGQISQILSGQTFMPPPEPPSPAPTQLAKAKVEPEQTIPAAPAPVAKELPPQPVAPLSPTAERESQLSAVDFEGKTAKGNALKAAAEKRKETGTQTGKEIAAQKAEDAKLVTGDRVTGTLIGQPIAGTVVRPAAFGKVSVQLDDGRRVPVPWEQLKKDTGEAGPAAPAVPVKPTEPPAEGGAAAEKVNIGPRDEKVSTGTGVETEHETKMISDWKKDIEKEKAKGAPAPIVTQVKPNEQLVHASPADVKKVSQLSTPKQMKVQKEFLVNAVREAAKNAPSDPAYVTARDEDAKTKAKGYRYTGKAMQEWRKGFDSGANDFVTFKVPDDGTYTVPNVKESLEAFADRTEKKFGVGLKAPTISSRAIPKLTPEEIAEHQKPFADEGSQLAGATVPEATENPEPAPVLAAPAEKAFTFKPIKDGANNTGVYSIQTQKGVVKVYRDSSSGYNGWYEENDHDAAPGQVLGHTKEGVIDRLRELGFEPSEKGPSKEIIARTGKSPEGKGAQLSGVKVGEPSEAPAAEPVLATVKTPDVTMEAKTTVEPKGDTTIEPTAATDHKVSTLADSKQMKAQKAFVLDAVKKAIANAPEEQALAEQGQKDLAVLKTSPTIANSAEGEPVKGDASYATYKKAHDEWMANSEKLAEQYTGSYHRSDKFQDDITEAAIRAKHGAQVTIDVPGDGTYTVNNSKAHLEAFADAFGSGFGKGISDYNPASSTSSAKAKPIPPVAKSVTPESIADAVSLSQNGEAPKGTKDNDMHRYTLMSRVHQDGDFTIATDGRRITVAKGGLGQTLDELNKTLPDHRKEERYPNWRQVVPKDLVTIGKDSSIKPATKPQVIADTSAVIKQLNALESMRPDAGPHSVVVYDLNGQLGISKFHKDLGSYHTEGVPLVEKGPDKGQPASATGFMAIDADYLKDAMLQARKLGNEKVPLSYKDDLSPLAAFIGKDAVTIIMPVRRS